MQRLLPSDSQCQTRSLCRMEMQHSMPSKRKQPNMKTKDKPRNQKQNTTPLESETCWSRSNWSIYFSLGYRQSLYNHKSINCYVQKMRKEGLALLKWHLTLSRFITSTDQHLRNTKTIQAEAVSWQISKHSACTLPNSKSSPGNHFILVVQAP